MRKQRDSTFARERARDYGEQLCQETGQDGHPAATKKDT